MARPSKDGGPIPRRPTRRRGACSVPQAAAAVAAAAAAVVAALAGPRLWGRRGTAAEAPAAAPEAIARPLAAALARAAAAAPPPHLGDLPPLSGVYLQHPPSDAPLDAYVLDPAVGRDSGGAFDADGATAVGDILRALHAQQHPPRASCGSRRLLVTQFAPTSFEGIGSLLKQVVLGLAEAAYANRTLVWGLDLSYMFERSRAVWRDDGARGPVPVAGAALDCSGWTRGGGPYECFFAPLSSCSLLDASPADVEQLATDGYNDAARMRIQESRRGPAAYAPPRGRFPAASGRPHLWPAALAAYAFRLKPALRALFDGRRPGAPWAAPVWALHVRHGDVSALEDIYGNRRVFGFDAFFAAAAALADASPPGVPPPATLFVASDDPDTAALAGAAAAAATARGAWGAAAPPRVVVQPPGARFLTPHGAHTAASEGGCVRDTCALHAGDVLHYRAEGRASGERQADRIMRVLAESVEDLYLLGQADALVTQASSHFSTMAALLVWARTGGAGAPASVAFVDAAAVEDGVVQCAYLHGALNRTAHVPPGRGGERWESHKRRFMEALALDGADPAPHLRHSAAVFGVGGPFRLSAGLPAMPPAVLDNEVRRWLGRPVGEVPRVPWTGECPLPWPGADAGGSSGAPPADAAPADLLSFAVELTNHGAAHHEWHPGQAVLCWRAARAAVARAVAGSGGDPAALRFGAVTAADLDDVLDGNLRATQSEHMYPYSMRAGEVCAFWRQNLGRGHAGCPPEEGADAGAEAGAAAPAPGRRSATRQRKGSNRKGSKRPVPQ